MITKPAANMASLKIRKEENQDHAAIRTVTKLAFRDMPYAGGDEQDVIERLRLEKALTLSLVAELEDGIIGHLAFSPALSSGRIDQWFALGPVSVLPAYQGQGVGSALIEAGLSQLKSRSALGCILTGNPEYYQRFGFELSPQHVPSNEAEAYFMLKLFTSVLPNGAFSFHSAFYGEC